MELSKKSIVLGRPQASADYNYPEEEKRTRAKSRNSGLSIRYRSWWKQGNIKMAVSEDHTSY